MAEHQKQQQERSHEVKKKIKPKPEPPSLGIPRPPAAPQSPSPSPRVVTVLDLIELISRGPPRLKSSLDTIISTIDSDKDKLRRISKENFLLHHDVVSLDEQIKMLVKNRITGKMRAEQFGGGVGPRGFKRRRVASISVVIVIACSAAFCPTNKTRHPLTSPTVPLPRCSQS